MNKTILRMKEYAALMFERGGEKVISYFLLITGYYMCDRKASCRKCIKLLSEAEIYSIVIYCVFAVIERVSIGRIVEVFFLLKE